MTITGSGNTTNHPTKELLAEAKRLREKFGSGLFTEYHLALEDLGYKELRKIVSVWRE